MDHHSLLWVAMLWEGQNKGKEKGEEGEGGAKVYVGRRVVESYVSVGSGAKQLHLTGNLKYQPYFLHYLHMYIHSCPTHDQTSLKITHQCTSVQCVL